MDIAKLHNLIGRLTDQQLAEEINKPSGMAPLYMVMSEMDRRARMRKSAPREPQSYADGGPVYDEDWYRYFQDMIPGVTVNSGYRDEEHNRRVGGAENSYHIRTPGRGQALDLRLPRGVSPQEALRLARGGPRPLSEALYHRNHLHVAWGGPRRYGAGEGPAPSGTAGAGNGGPTAPRAATPQPPNAGIAEYMRMMGIGDAPPSLQASFAEAAGLMPDRTTEPYNQLLAGMEQQRAQYERSQRGRPLMEMGLAMMGAKGPSFFNALAQGGMAGLSARDRAQQGQQAMMMQLLQGRMAQAQAQAQRDQSLMGVAGPMVNAQRSAIGQAAGYGLQQAQMAQQAFNADRAYALDQQRLAQDAQRTAAAQQEAAAQGARQDAELDLRRSALDLDRRRNPVLGPDMTAAERAAYRAQRATQIYQDLIKGSPAANVPGPRGEAARAQISREAQRRAWMEVVDATGIAVRDASGRLLVRDNASSSGFRYADDGAPAGTTGPRENDAANGVRVGSSVVYPQ